jgi:hypothetical protein
MVLGRIIGLLLQRSLPNLLVVCDLCNFKQKKFGVELYNALVLVRMFMLLCRKHA